MGLALVTPFWTFKNFFKHFCHHLTEKAMAPHSSTLAWKIPWTEEPGRLQFMGSLRVGHDWVTSLSLSTFMHWRRKWQPTPVFLPGKSQGRGSLVGCRLWGRTELDTTEVTWWRRSPFHRSKKNTTTTTWKISLRLYFWKLWFFSTSLAHLKPVGRVWAHICLYSVNCLVIFLKASVSAPRLKGHFSEMFWFSCAYCFVRNF